MSFLFWVEVWPLKHYFLGRASIACRCARLVSLQHAIATKRTWGAWGLMRTGMEWMDWLDWRMLHRLHFGISEPPKPSCPTCKQWNANQNGCKTCMGYTASLISTQQRYACACHTLGEGEIIWTHIPCDNKIRASATGPTTAVANWTYCTNISRKHWDMHNKII